MSEVEAGDAGLTAAEKHLLSRVLHDGDGAALMFELVYLIPAIVLFGVGLWHSSNAAFVSALFVVLTFRVWAIRDAAATRPVFLSALRKLCARARTFERDPGT